MPCQSYPSETVNNSYENSLREKNYQLTTINNRLARLLCKTLNNVLETEGEEKVIELGGKDALRWLTKHNKDDAAAAAAKKAREDAKKKADREIEAKKALRLKLLSELSDEELAALGVK